MDAIFIHGSPYLLVDPVIRRRGRQPKIGRGLIPWLKIRLHIAKWGIDNPDFMLSTSRVTIYFHVTW